MQRHRRALFFSSLMALAATACVTEVEHGNVEQALSTTYQVGPSQALASRKSLIELLKVVDLKAGDVVEVEGDFTYVGEVDLADPGAPGAPITIRGITKNGKRPVIKSGYRGFDVTGAHTVIENFEIVGKEMDNCVPPPPPPPPAPPLTVATKSCVYHHSDDLTIRNSVIHDCACNGIHSADTESGSLTVDRVEIYNSGAGTQNHTIYATSAIPDSVFRLRNSYIHDPKGGNVIKSRAARNEIYFNRIVGAAAAYRELELIAPETTNGNVPREDSDVVGNVFVHPHTTSAVVRVGGDSDANDTDGVYRFVNNTFLLGGDVTVVQRAYQIKRIEMHNNVLARTNGGTVKPFDTVIPVNAAEIVGSNNWLPFGTSPPAGWTATIVGLANVTPGFVNAGTYDVRLAAGSPLLNAGIDPPPPTQVDQKVHGVMEVPPAEPPLSALAATAAVRFDDGSIDIGAYERVGGAPVPAATLGERAMYLWREPVTGTPMSQDAALLDPLVAFLKAEGITRLYYDVLGDGSADPGSGTQTATVRAAILEALHTRVPGLVIEGLYSDPAGIAGGRTYNDGQSLTARRFDAFHLDRDVEPTSASDLDVYSTAKQQASPYRLHATIGHSWTKLIPVGATTSLAYRVILQRVDGYAVRTGSDDSCVIASRAREEVDWAHYWGHKPAWLTIEARDFGVMGPSEDTFFDDGYLWMGRALGHMSKCANPLWTGAPPRGVAYEAYGHALGGRWADW